MGFFDNVLGSAANAIKSSAGTAVSSFLNQASQGNIEGAINGLATSITQLRDNVGAFGAATPGDGLRGMNARSDAVQNWCWYCLLPDVKDSSAQKIAFGSSATGGEQIIDNVVSRVSVGGGGLLPTVSLPWYYVQSATIPFRTIETESITRNSHKLHYPEGYSVATLSMEFFMDSASVAQKYLKAWGGLVLGNQDPSIWSNRGKWGYPANYKKDINFYILSVTKRELLNLKYVGCWPTDPQALELASDNAAILTQRVNFHVEDVLVTVLNDKGIVDNLIDTGLGYGTSFLKGAAMNTINGWITGL